MRPACALARPLVLAAAVEDRAPARPVARHMTGCLRCQAEAARGRTMRRGLQALSTERYTPPRDLVVAVEARLGAPTRSRRRFVPVAAVAAAAVSMVVVVSLRRRLAVG